MTKTIIAALALAALTGAASAQQQVIIPNPDGTIAGRSTLDSEGKSIFSDADGKEIPDIGPDLRKPHVCPFMPPCRNIGSNEERRK